jgi:hypothetical protein
MLLFDDSQLEKGLNCCGEFVGATRLEVDFATF